jgi:uncharacterized protein YhaN
MQETQKDVGVAHVPPTSLRKKSQVRTREERRRRAQEMDEFRRRLSSLEKRFQEVERSLHEATQKLDDLNQKLSDPNLYLNPQETYDTIQTHRKVQEQVKELTQSWESLALELEEMKGMSI